MNETKNALTECEKMSAVQNKSLLLTEFVNWLGEQGLSICQKTERDHFPYDALTERYESLFSRFFNIDLDKVEKERQNMLKALRHIYRMKDNDTKNNYI